MQGLDLLSTNQIRIKPGTQSETLNYIFILVCMGGYKEYEKLQKKAGSV